MMKKKIMSCFLIINALFIITGCSKEYYITDNEHLYDTAVKYLIDNDTNPEKNKDRYKLFVDYEGFGITEDNNYRYAYMWIAEGAYYVVDNKIISGSGSSMPYRFTFEKNEIKVVKYEIPKDGNEYVSSIKKMYPNGIEDKAINYIWKDDKLTKEVKEYYSDLEDKNIYYNIGDSNNVKRTIEGNMKTYSELNDGTWMCNNYVYKYRLEISGRLPNATVNTTYVYLSNIENISFDKAYKASGISSNMNDYFSPEDAVLVEMN